MTIRGKDFEIRLHLPTPEDPWPAIRIKDIKIKAKGPDGGCVMLTSFGIRGGSITFEGICTDTEENRKLLGLDELLKDKIFGQAKAAIRPRPSKRKKS